LLNLNELTQLVQGKFRFVLEVTRLHALAMKGLMSGCGIKRKGEQILEKHGRRGKDGARDTPAVHVPVVSAEDNGRWIVGEQLSRRPWSFFSS
jgi:hypothetical protein